jgi:hypothetical protein
VKQLHGEPWQLAHVDPESDIQVVAHLTRGTQKLRVSLIITPAEPARIAGLIFAPDEVHKPFVAPASAAEAIERLKKFGALSLLVASTANGRCEPLLQVDADRSQPVGSAFKLWVLAALSKQVATGKLRWTDPVVIRDQLDSLPSGTTQNDPDGSTRTVRELAERMIAISDNTATDHLIVQVGRDAVQRAVAESGHAHPEVDRPFLTTREMFILKFGEDAALRSDYLAANEAGRRKLLGTRVASARLPDLVEAERKIAAGPLLIHEVEWFGSAFDLCRVWLALAADPAAREILALNPGVHAVPGRWSYLGFKGGSESGVLATAWRHDAASGSYVTAASVENSAGLLPESEVVQLLAAVRDFTPNF